MPMPRSATAEPWLNDEAPDYLPSPPPTQDELPCDDGEPMETQRHKWQMDLLIETLDPWLAARGEGYVNGNMFVYYTLEQTRGLHFRGPDCFVALGVPRGERKCWVSWAEGKAPDVVIELLSATTRRQDKGEKMQVYQDCMRVSEYFWFDPFNAEDFAGFFLNGGRYEPIEPDAAGRIASGLLGLTLRCWAGTYRGIEATWLRWATQDGELLPTDAEAGDAKAAAEAARADGEAARAASEAERANAERLRAERAEAELAALRAELGRRAGS
jgi:Uma2 family endonuclease